MVRALDLKASCIRGLARRTRWYQTKPNWPTCSVACWATTLWVQVVAALLLPTALLWRRSSERDGPAAGAPAAAGGAWRGRRDPDGHASRLQRWGRECRDAIDEAPLLASMFAAQLLWIVLRGACAAWLPAPPMGGATA